MSEEQRLNYNPVDSAGGMKKGKEIGVKEGGEKYKLKVALKCLIKGMDVRTIAEITDLPVERIELLKTAGRKENDFSDPGRYSKKELTIGVKTAKVVLKPITAREYYNFYQKSIAISMDWSFHLELVYCLRIKAPGFSLAHCYAALKTLFGESTTMFDDYKCSFGYTFLLEVSKNQGKSKYILNFTDKKGGIVFFFDKVMADNELDKYNTNTYHDPFEDEFSKEDMRYLMGWFTFYLAGFIESYQADYREEFFRSIHDGLIVYGYKQDNFFCKSYQDEDSFYKIIGNLKQENIPYNQVMPNE